MRVIAALPVFWILLSAGSAEAATFYDDCVSGDIGRILSGCSKVLSLGSRVAAANRAAAAYNLGWAYEKGRGEHDLAIGAYTHSIEFNPSYTTAYINRGTVYGRRGDIDKAVADFNVALSLDPKSAFAYQSRAEFWADRGNFAAALNDYSAQISLEPNSTNGYAARARVYVKRSELALALADLDKAIALQPEDAELSDQRRAVVNSILSTAAAPAAASTSSVQVARTDEAAKIAPIDRERIALVIGNSAYLDLPKLQNPRHDAEDLAEALVGLGFQVSLATDIDRNSMQDKLADFAKASRHAAVALIFFSGHGLQYNNINYIAPVDARIEDETDLRRLIPVQGVIEDLENAPKVRLLILDACRETGVLQRLAASLPAKRGASVKRGLVRDDAEGTFIAYSTQAGSVAEDGSGSRNSPFTTALLKHLPEPGVDLRVLFTRVRGDVYRQTNGAQNPEVSDSLVGEFAFK